MNPEPNSSSYYLRRAAEARTLAFAATLQGVRKIHLEMAANYERLAAEGGAIEAAPTPVQEAVAYAPVARTSVSNSQ